MALDLFKKKDPKTLTDAELIDGVKRFDRNWRIGFAMTFIPMLGVPIPMLGFLLLMPFAFAGLYAAATAKNNRTAFIRESEKRGLKIDAEAEAPAKKFPDLSPTFNPEAAVTLDNTVKVMPRIKIRKQPGSQA